MLRRAMPAVRRLFRAGQPPAEPREAPPAELVMRRFGSLAELRAAGEEIAAERVAQEEVERGLAADAETFRVPGFCYPCGERVRFLVDYRYAPPAGDGPRVPNWRERLLCPRCQLNNRMRATLHLFEALGSPAEGCRIYTAEQTTPIYRGFVERYGHVVGSEHLGDATPLGASNRQGIRNEDLTRLTFADESFDFAVSLDVFEHVPDFEKALAECARILTAAGRLFVTVPFRIDLQKNLVRATVDEAGRIHHLLEPEYHGDPLCTEGCLAFYHFGWELLDQLEEAGFADAGAYLYWSRGYGYLGGGQLMLVASKGAASTAVKTVGLASASS